MKVVLVSNFLNHHQIPFCEEMLKRCKDFYFLATDNGASQGYQTTCEKPYVVDYKKECEKAEQIVLDADAVIFGSCPNSLIKLRMDENKLSFFYSERFFKKGTWRRFIPTTRKSINNRIIQFKDKNIFVLCAGAYLPYDLSLLGFPTDKCFKWGYFPDCELDAELENKFPASILWSARMLDWKHPEIPVLVAEKLKKNGYKFTMNIVGEGEKLEETKALVKQKNVDDCVNFLGSLPHDELLSQMRKHKIFLMTSDKYEGWGAVLNEAMSSHCVPVASHAIGSVPFLIENGKNGLIFKSQNANDAYKKVKKLLDNSDMLEEMGNEAYKTMNENYNYTVAAERLMVMIEGLCQNGKMLTYSNGLLSKAEIIKDNSLR